jgi:hypothetical protein
VAAAGTKYWPHAGWPTPPDGIEIAWRVARIDTGAENRLPFVIDDLTDHDLRVPAGEAAVHANGTIGIGAVVFAVTSREAVRQAWTNLCGHPTEDDIFEVGDQTIRIAEAETLDDTSAQWLASRGSGPVEVMLRGTDRDLPTALTHNAHFTRFGQTAND